MPLSYSHLAAVWASVVLCTHNSGSPVFCGMEASNMLLSVLLWSRSSRELFSSWLGRSSDKLSSVFAKLERMVGCTKNLSRWQAVFETKVQSQHCEMTSLGAPKSFQHIYTSINTGYYAIKFCPVCFNVTMISFICCTCRPMPLHNHKLKMQVAIG